MVNIYYRIKILKARLGIKSYGIIGFLNVLSIAFIAVALAFFPVGFKSRNHWIVNIAWFVLLLSFVMAKLLIAKLWTT